MAINTRNWGDEFTQRAVTAAANKMNRLRTQVAGDLSKQRISDAGAMARTKVSEAGATQRQQMGDQTQLGVQGLRNTGALEERTLAEAGATGRKKMDQYQFELGHQLDKKKFGQLVREHDQRRRDEFLNNYMGTVLPGDENYGETLNDALTTFNERDRIMNMSPDERKREMVDQEISMMEQQMQGLSGRERLELAKGLDPEIRKALGYTDEFIAKYDKTSKSPKTGGKSMYRGYTKLDDTLGRSGSTDFRR